jgi:hypothetical protein
MVMNSAVAATPMSEKTKETFELVLMKYLQKDMGKQVTILDVHTTDQKVNIASNVTTRRYLQRENDDETSSRPVSTIEVSVNINGQYRPPPEIDYSGVVEDAMDSNPQDFEQSLRREDKYFEIIESVKAQKEETRDSNREDTPPPESPSGGNILVIIFVCLIVAFIAFVCGTIYYRRRQRKNKKFSRSSFVQDSKLLKEKKSLFGGFGKGGKSIMDAYSDADAVWAEKVPISSSTHVYQPSLNDDVYPASQYRDDPYEDEADMNEVKAFQDMGSYGYNNSQESFRDFRGSSHSKSRERDSFSSSFHSARPERSSLHSRSDTGAFESRMQSLPDSNTTSSNQNFEDRQLNRSSPLLETNFEESQEISGDDQATTVYDETNEDENSQYSRHNLDDSRSQIYESTKFKDEDSIRY